VKVDLGYIAMEH